MRLEQLQHFLADAFRRSEALSDDDDIAGEIRAVVAGNDRLTPRQQAEIYREQFWLRHIDALREDYPALRYLLGDEAFEQLARDYLTACPPDSFTLRDVGDRIATFADSYAGFGDHAGPARDLARFELAFVAIFDGADAEPISLEQVQAIAPEAWPSTVLSFHPLLTVLELSYPVHRIRIGLKDEQQPSRQLQPEPTFVAMWRGDDLKVHYRTISQDEAELLACLRDGASLGDALTEDVADELQGWFKGWAMRGWIVDLSPTA